MIGKVIGFLNIFDKEYQQLFQSKENGQSMHVPDTGALVTETNDSLLRAASVAVTRSGNENAVKRAKISIFL